LLQHDRLAASPWGVVGCEYLAYKTNTWTLSYTSGSPRLLEKITDPTVGVITFQYDGNNKLSGITDPAGGQPNSR